MTMRRVLIAIALLAMHGYAGATAIDHGLDYRRDILVTFADSGSRPFHGIAGAPYSNRRRYGISANARRHARAIERSYSLLRIEHWPIRSLAVYCLVYRVPEGSDRDTIIERLRADARVESAQAVHRFETRTTPGVSYDDTYAGLQRGLTEMEILAAHAYSRGRGVRVAIIDSHADTNHEDLQGRIRRLAVFSESKKAPDHSHGTAVVSIIGASANNAKGIVGIAPEAEIDLLVACWSERASDNAICDSFTLARALDSVVRKPPDVLNLSLSGPYDPILERLISATQQAGTIVVAARPGGRRSEHRFPASMPSVIGVGSDRAKPAVLPISTARANARATIFAPGEHIVVAMPDDNYGFRSGSSLATAHVSGVVALLLARAPRLPISDVRRILEESQRNSYVGTSAINACVALGLLEHTQVCR